MQRQPFGNAQANSPPLHHPVPQHVSTVPMMRSPPPAQSGPGSGYASPYSGNMNGQGQGGPFAPAFGNFMNDPTTAMGIQVGKTAMAAGQDYLDQNVRGSPLVFALSWPNKQAS